MVDASHTCVALNGVSAVAGGTTILRDVTLVIAPGECVAVLGANGAGKSSLLRLMNGLLATNSGSAHTPSSRDQALIFQRPVLLKRSVLDNVSFALKTRGVAADDAAEIAREKLAACGLATFADRYARTLSGGEQQKLALARAWALQPKLLLADEPTANLAPAAVHSVETILHRMHVAGATIVLATHNRGQAKRLATRVIFMADSTIVEDRPANDFFASPQSAEAIEYLAVERA